MKRINLIPPEAARRFTSRTIKEYIYKSWGWKAAFLILFLLFFSFSYEFIATQRYKHKISSAGKEIKKLDADLKRAIEAHAQIEQNKAILENENKQVQKRLSYLEKVRTERVSWSQVLVLIEKLSGSVLRFSKISFNKEAIVLSGLATDNARVSDLMQQFDESGYFITTSFNFTQKSKDKPEEGMVDFEITTHLAGN